MSEAITYKKIIRSLFSEEIECYVPDGCSISHPIIGLYDNKKVDCFLLYASSRDKKRYSFPTARIIVDSENEDLVLYKTFKDMPFSVFDGKEYYENEEIKNNIMQDYESEYQSLYEKVRIIAFRKSITLEEKKLIISFINTLKEVELKHLQPYLFELGQSFFEWVKKVM